MTETNSTLSNKLKKAGWVFLIGALFGAMIIYALRDDNRPIPMVRESAQPSHHLSLMRGAVADAPQMMMAKAAAPMMAESFAASAATDTAQNTERRTIAYTHSLTIEVANYDVMKKAIDAASADCQSGKFECELLNANISQDREYPNGNLSLRLLPPGVAAFKSQLAQNAVIRNESTSSEQLAEQITDLDQRLKTRTDYLNRLQELAEQKGNLEDTLRVQQELSNVIAEIENLKSQQRQTEKRVEKEILNISFQVSPPATATSAPLDRALKEFGRTVGTSFAKMVTTLGILLPWLLVFIIVILFGRLLFARNLNRKKQ